MFQPQTPPTPEADLVGSLPPEQNKIPSDQNSCGDSIHVLEF